MNDGPTGTKRFMAMTQLLDPKQCVAKLDDTSTTSIVTGNSWSRTYKLSFKTPRKPTQRNRSAPLAIGSPHTKRCFGTVPAV